MYQKNRDRKIEIEEISKERNNRERKYIKYGMYNIEKEKSNKIVEKEKSNKIVEKERYIKYVEKERKINCVEEKREIKCEEKEN
jgi:hypothetical protein